MDSEENNPTKIEVVKQGNCVEVSGCGIQRLAMTGCGGTSASTGPDRFVFDTQRGRMILEFKQKIDKKLSPHSQIQSHYV